MSEIWFDTACGELLIGSAVAEARMQEMGNMVVSLPALISGEEACPPALPIDRRPVNGWTREEIVQAGQWALSLLEQASEGPVTLKQVHMRRLYELGLGPHWGRQRHFSSMGELRRETGSAKGPDKGLFDYWSACDFATYAAKLSRQIGRRPRHQDYALAAKQQGGPGMWVINQRFGNVGNLNELAGYPNIRTWDNDDYVSWGVRVMRANDGRPITYGMMEALSRRQQGPSEYPIVKRFGAWSEYKKQVLKQFQAEEHERQDRVSARLDNYRTLVTAGILPSRLRPASDEELRSFGSRYTLASHLLSHHAGKHSAALIIAEESAGSFIPALRKRNMHLTAAVIETEAVILDVYDDIWPSSEVEAWLRVA